MRAVKVKGGLAKIQTNIKYAAWTEFNIRVVVVFPIPSLGL